MKRVRENREDAPGEKCYRSGCTNEVFRWWPWTEDGLNHKGQSMLACRKHFHELWAGES